MTPAEADRDTSLYDLPADLVRVWRVHLDGVPARFDRLEKLLSPDEVDRARRFQFERDRRRFTVARGALRTILGGYLQLNPMSIVFDYGPQGKPFLAPATSFIRFNVAHSGELALIAVSRERELGVDVEFVRSLTGAEQIADGFFSPREAAVFRSLPRDLVETAFFACWTRKEAYIKARGGGLSIPLDRFDVSLEPGKPAALLEVRDDPIEASRWSMVELQPASGYAGALVVQGEGWNLSYCDWSGEAR
jgi:4'-phosphopantetheinyl transferase